MNFSDYYKKTEVVDSYDKLRTNGIKSGIIRKLERMYVEELIKNLKDKKIFEIGVGTGFISEILIDKGKFLGGDVSKEMLNRTRLKFKDKEFIYFDLLNSKINKKFDIIVSVRVLSHFDKKNLSLAIKNISSILNDEGKAIFNIENPSLFRRTIRKVTNWGSTKNYQYSEKEMTEILKNEKLIIEGIIYLDHLFILPLHIINLILFKKLSKLIINLEFKLKKVKIFSNNSFIRCRK